MGPYRYPLSPYAFAPYSINVAAARFASANAKTCGMGTWLRALPVKMKVFGTSAGSVAKPFSASCAATYWLSKPMV